MGEFSIKEAYVFGHQQYVSGDIVLKLKVDKSKIQELLPFFLLPSDQPLTVTISDSSETSTQFRGILGGTVDPSIDQAPLQRPTLDERVQQYRRIEGLLTQCGYTQETKRDLFKRITGKTSKMDMNEVELYEVKKHLQLEVEGDLEEHEPTG